MPRWYPSNRTDHDASVCQARPMGLGASGSRTRGAAPTLACKRAPCAASSERSSAVRPVASAISIGSQYSRSICQRDAPSRSQAARAYPRRIAASEARRGRPRPARATASRCRRSPRRRRTRRARAHGRARRPQPRVPRPSRARQRPRARRTRHPPGRRSTPAPLLLSCLPRRRPGCPPRAGARRRA